MDKFTKHLNTQRSERAIVFDMDDTLCLYDKQLGLYNCQHFVPNSDLVEKAKNYQSQGYDLIVATARPSWTSYGTFKWLKQHGLRVQGLYLKVKGIWTPPYLLKPEMITDIQKKWEVAKFYDDNPLTCQEVAKLEVAVEVVRVTELCRSAPSLSTPLGVK
jgi:FMN phosphatase YigB (HAD superfamily)